MIVWLELQALIGCNYVWKGGTFEYCLNIWYDRKELNTFRQIPYIIYWGISLA